MLTNRKKLRHRKQVTIKVGILIGAILLSVVVGYVIALKLFVRSGYISPLSSIILQDDSSKDDAHIVFIQNSLEGQKLEVDSVKREGESYTVKLKNGEVVLLSATKDLKSQISSLQFIVSRLTMEGKLFSQLDLRFDKPVITF